MEKMAVIIELSLMPKDVLILCTDGFWQNISVSSIINLTMEEIQTVISTHENFMEDNYSYLKISL
jgi:serine/threonine protein phosphatase PrpC